MLLNIISNLGLWSAKCVIIPFFWTPFTTSKCIRNSLFVFLLGGGGGAR